MAKFCESLIILLSMQMKMEMVISPGGKKKKLLTLLLFPSSADLHQ